MVEQVSRADIEKVAAKRLEIEKGIITVGVWAWLGPEEASRPANTVARGIWSDLFSVWEEGSAAYWGAPVIVGLDGGHGLATIQARFRSGCAVRPLILKSQDVVTADTTEIIEGPFLVEKEIAPDYLYLAEIRGSAPQANAELLMGFLKEQRVHYQSTRSGDVLRSLVRQEYRKRTGVWAVFQSSAGQSVILCSNAVGQFLGPRNRALGNSFAVVGVYEKSLGSKCGLSLVKGLGPTTKMLDEAVQGLG